MNKNKTPAQPQDNKVVPASQDNQETEMEQGKLYLTWIDKNGDQHRVTFANGHFVSMINKLVDAIDPKFTKASDDWFDFDIGARSSREFLVNLLKKSNGRFPKEYLQHLLLDVEYQAMHGCVYDWEGSHMGLVESALLALKDSKKKNSDDDDDDVDVE